MIPVPVFMYVVYIFIHIRIFLALVIRKPIENLNQLVIDKWKIVERCPTKTISTPMWLDDNRLSFFFMFVYMYYIYIYNLFFDS